MKSRFGLGIMASALILVGCSGKKTEEKINLARRDEKRQYQHNGLGRHQR